MVVAITVRIAANASMINIEYGSYLIALPMINTGTWENNIRTPQVNKNANLALTFKTKPFLVHLNLVNL